MMDQNRISLKELKYNNLKEKSEINLPGDIVIFDNGDLEEESITFEVKSFICGKLIFENFNNPKFHIRFYDCTFNCEVEFNNCNFEELSFKNTKEIKSLTVKGKDDVNKAKLNYFRFYNEENLHNDENPRPQLNTVFNISNLIISDTLSIENIDHIAGKFEFTENELSKGEQEFIRFKNSRFYNAYFYKNDFKSKTSFTNTTFKYDLKHLKPVRTQF